jgi:hypothetical protein
MSFPPVPPPLPLPSPPFPPPIGGPGDTLPSYTHCTDRADYKDQPTFSGWDPAAFIIDSCAYGQGGKLVCLPATTTEPTYRCAVGRVIEIEETGYDKVGYEALDNDWCINLLLAPQELSDFTPTVDASTGKRTPYDADKAFGDALAKPQGELLAVDKTVMPAPHEGWATSPVCQVPYFYDQQNEPILFHFNIGQPVPLDIGPNLLANLYNPLEGERDAARAQLAALFGVDVTKIPVLHCEVEGSREHDFCAVAVPLAEGAKAFSDGCHAALGWVPFGIGDAVCKLVSAVVSWLAAAAAALAGLGTWGMAHPGDELVGGLIQLGDAVALSGRWVFDAAHQGQNELHPVLTVQKLGEGDFSAIDDVKQFQDDWCSLISEAPPPDEVIGSVTSGLTPAQQAVHGNQQQPSQRWRIHPAVDGCRGSIDLSFSPPPAAPAAPPPIR